MMSKGIRVITFTLFVFFYILIPLIFITYAYYQEYPIPEWASYFKYALPFAFFFFIAVGYYISANIFPKTAKGVVELFIPYGINAVFIYFSRDMSSLTELLTLHGITTYVALTLGYAIMLFFVPWPTYEGVDKEIYLRGFKSKIDLIRKKPTILIGIIVLLIPLSYSIYCLIAGIYLSKRVYASLIPEMPGWILYIATLINIVAFHYKLARRAQIKAYGGFKS